MAFCGKCGTQLKEGAKFCPNCGQPINAVSQQQVNQPQQQYVVQSVDNKSVGKQGKKNGVSKWLWIAAGVILVIIILALIGGRTNTNTLQEDVKEMMVEKMKEKGHTLKIIDLTLIHKDGNNYTGLATCVLDGEDMEMDVNVVCDGNSFQAEWAPTAEYRQKVWEKAWDDAEKEFDREMKKAEDEYNRAIKESEEEWERTERELERSARELEYDLY